MNGRRTMLDLIKTLKNRPLRELEIIEYWAGDSPEQRLNALKLIEALIRENILFRPRKGEILVI